MAASKRSKKSLVFRTRAPVEIRPAKFKRSAGLGFLNADKLGKASEAEFEYGHVIDGSSRRAVHAIVRKGKVVGLRVEGCADCPPMKVTPGLDRLIRQAKKKLGGGRDSRPVPVAQFLARQQGPIIERSHCWMICIFGICIICCHCCSLNLFGWSCSILGGARSQ